MNKLSVTSIVCCTSNSALFEPRAPKFVAALSNQFPNARIAFIDASSGSRRGGPSCISSGSGAVYRKTCRYPTKRSGIFSLLFAKVAQELSKGLYRLFGKQDVRSISIVAPYLRRSVATEEFELILGHNIDTLPIVCELGRSRGAKRIFDCMEFYSDMGEGQSELRRRAIRDMEASYLPHCDLVLASSREVAEALEQHYGLTSVVAVYNAAPVTKMLSPKVSDGRFHLYWRNATVGISQRGLGDALKALTFLSDDVVLNVQGRPGRRMARLEERVVALGIEDRVIFHEAYPSGNAVLSASRYSVGLCVERDTCLNQRLTVSNKIFDYLMAGLAVVCSDLPGISSVVADSHAGLLYRAGDACELANRIRQLYEDRDMLSALQSNARTFSMTRVNEAIELDRFSRAISQLGLRT